MTALYSVNRITIEERSYILIIYSDDSSLLPSSSLSSVRILVPVKSCSELNLLSELNIVVVILPKLVVC